MNITQSKQDIFSVSKLNRLVKRILESEVGLIWVSAEISNFVIAASGHWYFTLKDEKAQIKAAMFKGSNRRVNFTPKEGDKVLVNGNLGLYEPRGDYQLIVEKMEPEGLGKLKQAFDQLKNKLYREGLFDTTHKKPIPTAANKVGIITSSSGAALHDILTVYARRSPQTQIVIYPSQVQGDGAASHLIKCIEVANQRNEVDVLILGRGGGSLEDLWCFNDENLARAIFASTLPIISAVGHEVDVTISDFVADQRAPTPSAAAEIASYDHAILEKQLAAKSDELIKTFGYYMERLNRLLAEQKLKLGGLAPRSRLNQQSQTLDFLTSRLKNVILAKTQQAMTRHQNMTEKFNSALPIERIETLNDKRVMLENRLLQAISLITNQKRQLWQVNSQLLDSVSPLATLNRGYSISTVDNQLITSIKQVKIDDNVITRIADGEFLSQVKQVKGQNV